MMKVSVFNNCILFFFGNKQNGGLHTLYYMNIINAFI